MGWDDGDGSFSKKVLSKYKIAGRGNRQAFLKRVYVGHGTEKLAKFKTAPSEDVDV